MNTGMIRIRHYSVIIVLLICAVFFLMLSGNAQKSENRRPRVALVLSGGGARGLAHVGVIKILEKYGIQPDIVVGTSMGSLVGGLYASGYDSALLEKTALSIDWEFYMNDSINRNELPYDEKPDDGKFILSVPFYKGTLPQTTGIIEGVKLHCLLNRLLFHVRSVPDFNLLSTPFACVATDIYTGEAVILNRGHLPTALRASMAIPSIFTPVEIDGRVLVDGGLVLNFPVQVARDMSADIVIGVDVGTPLYKKGEPLSIPKIIDQISSFRGSESTEKQRGLCDILITPDLEGFSSTDFDRTPEFIARGEKAALAREAELKALAEDQNRYGITRRKTVQPEEHEKTIYISKLRVEGLNDVSRQLLYSRLQLELPAYLTIEEIEKAVIRAYGSRFFKSVTYRIAEESGKNIVIFTVEETGMDFLNLGIGYDSDMKSAILLNVEFKNILGDGSRFDIEARLGESPAFSSGYYSGTGWPIGFGFGTKVWHETIDAFLYVNNRVSGEYRFNTYGMNIFTSLVLYHNLELGFGLTKEFMKIDNVITMEEFSEDTVDYLNPYIFLHIDTIDRSSFPRSGILFSGEAKYISSSLQFNKPDPTSIRRYFLNTQIFLPLHPGLTLIFTNFLGMINGGNIPIVYYFAIGGMSTRRDLVFPFIGLNYMEDLGTNIDVIGAGLQYEFYKNFFITARCNAARITEKTGELFTGGFSTVHGYGLTAGYLSILGPVEFTFSRGTSHNFIYHIRIGFIF